MDEPPGEHHDQDPSKLFKSRLLRVIFAKEHAGTRLAGSERNERKNKLVVKTLLF